MNFIKLHLASKDAVIRINLSHIIAYEPSLRADKSSVIHTTDSNVFVVKESVEEIDTMLAMINSRKKR